MISSTKKSNGFVINRATLSDQIYDYLRGEILTGRVLPGERLDLGGLVARLKVSKMPVKEAIGRLATEGLLDVQAQRGTFISRVDPRELAETFEVRRALEMLAGELACARVKNPTPNSCAALSPKWSNPLKWPITSNSISNFTA